MKHIIRTSGRRSGFFTAKITDSLLLLFAWDTCKERLRMRKECIFDSGRTHATAWAICAGRTQSVTHSPYCWTHARPLLRWKIRNITSRGKTATLPFILEYNPFQETQKLSMLPCLQHLRQEHPFIYETPLNTTRDKRCFKREPDAKTFIRMHCHGQRTTEPLTHLTFAHITQWNDFAIGLNHDRWMWGGPGSLVEHRWHDLARFLDLVMNQTFEGGDHVEGLHDEYWIAWRHAVDISDDAYVVTVYCWYLRNGKRWHNGKGWGCNEEGTKMITVQKWIKKWVWSKMVAIQRRWTEKRENERTFLGE